MQPANLLFIMSDEHDKRPRHPFTDAMRQCLCFDEAFDAPMVRRAIAAYKQVIAECDVALRKVVDPEAIDKLAKADQRAHIEKHGGKGRRS